MPKVSVIIPVYNVEMYLRRCIDSVLNQPFDDTEIILIDDGTTDNSGAICDEYAKSDNRIRVIHKENGGLSDARNAGIEAATGENIFFIDGDDFIENNALSILYDNMKKENADISAGGIFNCYQNKKVPQYPKIEYRTYSGPEALREVLAGKIIPGSICGKLIKAELLNTLRFRVGRTYEDAFIMPNLMLSAGKVVATTEPLYNYYHRAGSITTTAFSPKRFDVIDAYEYTKECVNNNCPSLLPYADFRLLWAHFIVLDSMLLSKDYKSIPGYKETVMFLKKNWISAAKCRYFEKSRRFAAVVLKISTKLYRRMVLVHDRKNKIEE